MNETGDEKSVVSAFDLLSDRERAMFAPRPPSPVPVKQVIVVDKTYKKMRTGKWIGQGGHAGMLGFFEHATFDGDDEAGGRLVVTLSRAEWLWARYNFKKVVLGVPNVNDLVAVHRAACAAGLVSVPVIDSGLTEFHGQPTWTMIAIGPDFDEKIDAVTGPNGPFADRATLF